MRVIACAVLALVTMLPAPSFAQDAARCRPRHKSVCHEGRMKRAAGSTGQARLPGDAALARWPADDGRAFG